MHLDALKNLRVVFVTGKGGVGKTTIAAAMARALAASGSRTLAVEVVEDEEKNEKDAPLASMLGGSVRDGEPMLVDRNLHVAALSPSSGHKAFLRDTLPVKVLADAAMKSQAVRRFLHAAPTFPELGVLYRLLDLSRARRSDGARAYDHIVVDLPATGHALALVQVPSAVLRVVTGGAIGQAVRAGLELLCDPASTGAFVVTLPEPLPVSESLELAAGLEQHRVAVAGVILNRVPRDPFDDAELEAALALCAGKPTLGGRTVQRIARARKARARLAEIGRGALVELHEHDGGEVLSQLVHGLLGGAHS